MSRRVLDELRRVMAITDPAMLNVLFCIQLKKAHAVAILTPHITACAVLFRVTSACFSIPSLQPDYPSSVQFVIGLNDGKFSFVFGVLQDLPAHYELSCRDSLSAEHDFRCKAGDSGWVGRNDDAFLTSQPARASMEHAPESTPGIKAVANCPGVGWRCKS